MEQATEKRGWARFKVVGHNGPRGWRSGWDEVFWASTPEAAQAFSRRWGGIVHPA